MSNATKAGVWMLTSAVAFLIGCIYIDSPEPTKKTEEKKAEPEAAPQA